jgi:hypothetical protein
MNGGRFSQLLHSFFHTWSVWRFGAGALPVCLSDEPSSSPAAAEPAPPLEAPPAHLTSQIGASEWTKHDRTHLMPIITPCR